MSAGQLREAFHNENACHNFFESIIWVNDWICPHCGCDKSYEPITEKKVGP